jgi:hypothetical protein
MYKSTDGKLLWSLSPPEKEKLMPTDKNDETNRLRCLVQASADLRETDRADLGLTTLSFQSALLPNRHVWADTDLAGSISVDLEDWLNSGEWDNSVARLVAQSIESCSNVIIAWLSGRSVAECRQLCDSDARLQ